MSLKNKVGNFFILFGLVGLLVFVASVLAPPESFDSGAFLVGAALIGVGLNFRLSKVRPRAGGPPAGGGGAPAAAPRPAALEGAPNAKRQGLFGTILHGPANKKSAPSGGKPGGGGGGGGAGGKGGGGGKPGSSGGKGGGGGGGGGKGGGGGRK